MVAGLSKGKKKSKLALFNLVLARRNGKDLTKGVQEIMKISVR